MPEQGRVTAEDVMRGVAKLGFGGRGIIGNCARPERESGSKYASGSMPCSAMRLGS